MSNDYFSLPKETQGAIINSAESSLGLIGSVIEKDIWLCKLLSTTFELPINMVFKGGTSLSKAYNLIERFSEDVDITIDYRHFRDPIDFENTSRSQLKKISAELKHALNDYINTHVITKLKDEFSDNYPNTEINISVSNNGEQVRVYYPSVLSENDEYLKDHILLEFGIRNEIVPQEKHTIKPYLSDIQLSEVRYPEPIIETLSPIRTFWEKATLIHVECHRNKLQQSPDRLSRHWYDLFMLNQSWVGSKAFEERPILEQVIRHKKAFFNASYANYNDCLQGKFRIIPKKESLEGLENDFTRMRQAGMFYDTPPDFSEVIESLMQLESSLNK